MKAFWKENRWYVLLSIVSLAIIVGSLWEVLKPVPLPTPATRAEIIEARELGLAWLANNFDGEVFAYEFDPELDEVPRSSNALRQLMASRVAAVEAGPESDFLSIHEANLAYVLAEWYREDENGAHVLFKDKSKLGANAMLLRTLVDSPQFSEYEREAARIAEGMIALQNEDGSFEPWYVEPSYEFDAEYLMYFYSGEAILALLEYYEKTGDESVFLAAEQAAHYYLDAYVGSIATNYNPAYVPWHTLSYAKLFALTGEERYVEAIYTMNDRLLELLDTQVRPGRFYQRDLENEGQVAPHSSSDGVYVEGLIYAYELARDNGEVERAQRYEAAISLGLARLVNLQYQAAEPTFLADPVTYIGAMPIREGTPRIRVDTIQHTLDAMEKYLTVFE